MINVTQAFIGAPVFLAWQILTILLPFLVIRPQWFNDEEADYWSLLLSAEFFVGFPWYGYVTALFWLAVCVFIWHMTYLCTCLISN